MIAMPDLLDRIYFLDYHGKVDAALDHLFEWVDDELQAGMFQTVDDLLFAVQPDRCGTTLLLGILTITGAAREKLPSRARFYESVSNVLHQRHPGRVERLLHGLK